MKWAVTGPSHNAKITKVSYLSRITSHVPTSLLYVSVQSPHKSFYKKSQQLERPTTQRVAEIDIHGFFCLFD